MNRRNFIRSSVIAAGAWILAPGIVGAYARESLPVSSELMIQNSLREQLEAMLESFRFEVNNDFTRRQIVVEADRIGRQFMASRKIVAFHTFCDDTNNSPVSVDRNELIMNFCYTPSKNRALVNLKFVIHPEPDPGFYYCPYIPVALIA